MTDDEYREFLTFLFERYVRTRLQRVRRRFHHHMMEEWSYHLDQAQQAGHVLRYIEAHCDDDGDAYRTFTRERLGRAVSDTHNSLDFANRVAEEAGLLDAFEAHADEILGGLQPHHLPDVDKDVLREMGSLNPEIEIRVLVMQAKNSCDRLKQSTRELSVREQLKLAEQRLARAQQEFANAREHELEGARDKPPTKSRRWFKGLGQIAQGAALSIANVALAVGVLRFPVSPETQTWGAVASVATGIGTVLNGVGELRNE